MLDVEDVGWDENGDGGRKDKEKGKVWLGVEEVGELDKDEGEELDKEWELEYIPGGCGHVWLVVRCNQSVDVRGG